MAATTPVTNEDRLRRIAQITDTTLAHLDVADLLDELLDRVRALLDADTAAVLLLDPSSTYLVATAARGIEEEVRQGVRIPVGKGFAGRIAAERRPVIIDEVDHSNVLNPILREKDIRSLLGVPLVAEGGVLGVLHVGTLTPRRFTMDDADLLQTAADRIALVTRTRLSDLDRAAASALQRSLMPGALPRVTGIEFAARYIPGEAGGLGGDWYDVFSLPSGRLGVVIGDVVGRGLQAAVIMGRLRSALRAFALEEDDPAEVLERLDGNVQHFEENVMATVLYAIFEPSLERVSLSSAGHLPPIIAQPGEQSALLNVPIDLPVGVSVGPPRRTTSIDLPDHGLLFLYTDGLVERRGSPLDAGLDALCEVVRAEEAESVCSGVLHRMIGADPGRRRRGDARRPPSRHAVGGAAEHRRAGRDAHPVRRPLLGAPVARSRRGVARGRGRHPRRRPARRAPTSWSTRTGPPAGRWSCRWSWRGRRSWGRCATTGDGARHAGRNAGGAPH